jgi:hypothetical protein
VAHFCSFHPAEVSGSYARNEFLVWDDSLATVMVLLLENHEIEEHGTSQLATGHCNLCIAAGMLEEVFQCGAS